MDVLVALSANSASSLLSYSAPHAGDKRRGTSTEVHRVPPPLGADRCRIVLEDDSRGNRQVYRNWIPS
jgi:hypothetical protein